MASQLFGIAPDDPATFSLVAVVLAIVALTAAALPAVRATRVDPMQALRQEN
jgi:ABC-type lipoprotein release transport system permease subunit